MLGGMYVTKSISTGLYPNLDLWTANKLQLQLPSQIQDSSTCFVLFFSISCCVELKHTS